MRKLFLLTIITLSVGASTYAQKTSFGIKAGANLANIVGDNTDNLVFKTGFHVGAFVEVGLSDKFSIQPEALYSLQGTKSEYTDFGADVEENLDINYLTIPVIVKYYITENLSINAGPQMGFLLSSNYTYEVEEFDIKEEMDYAEYLSFTDFSLALGAEYKTAFGLRLHTRYNLGLSNINNEDLISSSNQNAVLQFGIGFGL